MRPRGDIRAALLQIARLRERFTWRELAEAAQVGWEAAKQTIKNMVRSGELVKVGEMACAHAKRPLALYAYRGLAASLLA